MKLPGGESLKNIGGTIAEVFRDNGGWDGFVTTLLPAMWLTVVASLSDQWWLGIMFGVGAFVLIFLHGAARFARGRVVGGREIQEIHNRYRQNYRPRPHSTGDPMLDHIINGE